MIETFPVQKRPRRAAACAGAVVLISCLAACATTGSTPSLYGAQAGIERYISSGAYEKDFAAVAARALSYMETRASRVTRPAIVLDIDETSLSNWPAYRKNE